MPSTSRGRRSEFSLFTDEHLNVLKPDKSPDPDVWAIGDAARIQSQDVLPATAQGMEDICV
jgi:hypothetical protein